MISWFSPVYPNGKAGSLVACLLQAALTLGFCLDAALDLSPEQQGPNSWRQEFACSPRLAFRFCFMIKKQKGHSSATRQ